MEKLPMCRLCLADNLRMYRVVNRNLHRLYEKLTDIPFVTDDSRPIFACYFCCAKLKQCYRLLRQCLEAEELFTQGMNEDDEPNPVINQDRLQLFSGFIKSPIEHIHIDDECQSIAIKEELPAVCEGVDSVVEPKDENESDELELEHLYNSCLDVRPSHHSHLEDDEPLIELKTEVEDEEVPKKKRRATETKKLKLENLDSGCLDVADISPHHSESDLEDDEPLMKFKTEVEGEEVYKKRRRARDVEKATVAKKPKLDTRRIKEKDAILVEQTTIDKSDSKVIRTAQKHTSKPGTYFKEPYKCSQPGEKSYKCDVCQRNFTKKSSLTSHIRTHTGEKPYKCDVCQCSFTEKSALTKHIRIHTGEKPYQCEVCQRLFRERSSLTSHIRTHTGEKPYKCDVCQFSFSEKSSLTSHIRTHTGEKPYKCDVCRCSFSEKRSLTSHIRTHTGEKPYKCDVCQCSFSEKSSLTKHIRIHTGEKPYKCDVCQRNFREKGSLTKHIRLHTGEKPYKCDVCQRSFGEKSSLTKHIRIHTGEKPYKCDFCRLSFRQKGDLTKHKRIHTGVKPHKCDVCQRNFREKSSLTSHIRTHTGEKPFKCDVCQRTFTVKCNLAKHIHVHTG